MKLPNVAGRRVVVAGLFSAKQKDLGEVVASVESEIRECGAFVVGTVIQRRGVSRSRRPGGSKKMDVPLDPSTVIGAGKLAELCRLVQDNSADIVVFLNQLSSSQLARIQDATGCEVLVRPVPP